MKKYTKIIPLVLVLILIFSIGATVFAGGSALDPRTIQGDTTGTDTVQKVGKSILGIVQVVGSIAAVIILVVIGIKYMLGSAEERAEYKKTMIPYLVGAVLIFAASNIAGMIYNWATSGSLAG